MPGLLARRCLPPRRAVAPSLAPPGPADGSAPRCRGRGGVADGAVAVRCPSPPSPGLGSLLEGDPWGSAETPPRAPLAFPPTLGAQGGCGWLREAQPVLLAPVSSPLASRALRVTSPLSLLAHQITRASITALEAITISSRKDLPRLKRRPPWISPSCPPRGRRAPRWGPWSTPCPAITPPARPSASPTSCRTRPETRPAPNPTCPGPCTPCPPRFLGPVLRFPPSRSTAVLATAITCPIHQK